MNEPIRCKHCGQTRQRHMAFGRCVGGSTQWEPDVPANPRPPLEPTGIDEIMTRIYRRFKDWSERKFTADDVTWCEVKADVLKIIEARTKPELALLQALVKQYRIVVARHPGGFPEGRLSEIDSALASDEHKKSPTD
jgi:hypothetical protein